MAGMWLNRLRRRRGASVLELAVCWLVLFTFAVGMVRVGSFYWGATTLSTTADVAALSAQSAYDRVRFGPGVLSGPADQANQAQARSFALSAASVVINGAAREGEGPFAFSDARCGSSTPGSPLAREVTTGEYSSGETAIHSFTVRLSGPVGFLGGCQSVTSVLSSARLGR